MTPWLDDGDVRLFHGQVLDVLRALPGDSIDCVVTSPPYWGLRDYGCDGQIGLEPTPEAFVARLVEVFAEVRRVLAPHGCCWVNLGDSYWGGGGGSYGAGKSVAGREGAHLTNVKNRYCPDGLKPKDLVGIPWRVALALQADGWWLRSDVVWSKPNPMPESVTDRPTRSHEYLFLLTRSARYFWDAEAVREPHVMRPQRRPDGHKRRRPGPLMAEHTWSGTARDEPAVDGNPAGRNLRSVWEIATQPFPEAHFATFPEALVERCLAAGCAAEVCTTCGEPRRRETLTKVAPGPATRRRPLVPAVTQNGQTRHGADSATFGHATQTETLGWTDCGHGAYRPGIVLDPFIGSGTTALVARRMGRHAVGIDLSAEYLAIAGRRLQQLSLLG